MQSGARHLVVLGTGGTIAGEAGSPDDELSYRSAARPVGALLASLPTPAGLVIESEQIAQLDSKDMDFATWRLLAHGIARHLERAEVAGVVVTHGSDTLEETAYFLQRVLVPRKPVVLTAAMRPATSRRADGPQNLADAITLASSAEATGVVVVVAGAVHAARDVRKVHPQRLDAFGSGEGGPLARIDGGLIRMQRPWPEAQGAALDLALLPERASAWPWVAIVTSTAASDPRNVRSFVADGIDGIVIATTGNGTVHCALEPPLREAMARGCAVLRATRCLAGEIVEPQPAPADGLPSAGALTPQQARVELIVRLLERRDGRDA